jgi:hypothetical protein
MFSARNWLRALVFVVPVILASTVHAFVVDDDVPDVTGRVARISYSDGDVQIRRAGSTDWEKAVTNLPVVEGDEIATSTFAKLEIEFDSRTFVRVQEKTVVTVTTLRDDGIALSVPQGTVSVRVMDFDKDRSYFEIDFPRSTVAIERSGSYRVDSGDRDSATARVRVSDDGEARIYSDTSGFSLRSGRAATIYLSGPYEGEWDTGDVAQFADSFDDWTQDRDKTIAKRMRDAYYDKYYDRDIYGAEDLNDYGEWIYTNNYGYVWRPFRSALSSYADWSPYRYGHWRWVPPYGWTWINDEPWGWATYHYGRWVYDNGYWFWTPYGYYRYRRSWWQPALVVINIFNNNVCWYPLGYYNRYHNYNRGGRGGWGGGGGGRGNSPGPRATPTPGGTLGEVLSREDRQRLIHTPTMKRMPPNSVVAMSLEEFGRGRGGIRRPSIEVAKTVVEKDENDAKLPPALPTYEQVKPKLSPEISRQTPPIIAVENTTRVGAAARKTDKPLDDDLRRTRVFGNRPPVVPQQPAPAETRTNQPKVEAPEEPRRTGAVNRPTFKQREETHAAETPPIVATPQTEQPRRKDEQRIETPKPVEPRSEPPRRIERQETPRVEQPKYEPPPRREEPRREEPRSSPPQKSEPPPQKSEPKVDKPSPPSQPSVVKGKKDGR